MLNDQELNRMAAKAKSGDVAEANALLLKLSPLISGVVERMGIRPTRPSYPMNYDEAVEEGYWILWFQVLPRYDEKRGDFTPFAFVFLNRELKKRIYRLKHRLDRHVLLTESLAYFETEESQSSDVIEGVNRRAGRALQSKEESKLFRIATESDEVLSLREIARRMNLPVATAWRVRRRVAKRLQEILA